MHEPTHLEAEMCQCVPNSAFDKYSKLHAWLWYAFHAAATCRRHSPLHKECNGRKLRAAKKHAKGKSLRTRV